MCMEKSIVNGLKRQFKASQIQGIQFRERQGVASLLLAKAEALGPGGAILVRSRKPFPQKHPRMINK